MQNLQFQSRFYFKKNKQTNFTFLLSNIETNTIMFFYVILCPLLPVLSPKDSLIWPKKCILSSPWVLEEVLSRCRAICVARQCLPLGYSFTIIRCTSWKVKWFFIYIHPSEYREQCAPKSTQAGDAKSWGSLTQLFLMRTVLPDDTEIIQLLSMARARSMCCLFQLERWCFTPTIPDGWQFNF